MLIEWTIQPALDRTNHVGYFSDPFEKWLVSLAERAINVVEPAL